MRPNKPKSDNSPKTQFWGAFFRGAKTEILGLSLNGVGVRCVLFGRTSNPADELV